MTIVRRKLSDLPPLTQEELASQKAYRDGLKAEGIDLMDLAGWTAEEKARSAKASDYPTLGEAMDEANHLADVQAAGMGAKELEAYKESRIGHPATV